MVEARDALALVDLAGGIEMALVELVLVVFVLPRLDDARAAVRLLHILPVVLLGIGLGHV